MINAKTELLSKVRAGVQPIGTFVTSIDPATSSIFGSVGFDFVIIDCEHGPMDKVHALNHVRAAEAAGIFALARILEKSASQIQSFLDIGVQGVIVPHVDNAEQAQTVAKACRYGPGGRGMCPICNAARYSLDGWQEHMHQSNENILSIIMIESRAGVENIEAIAAVDGIDGIMFGPGDLSQDMGLDLVSDKAQLTAAWDRVRNAVRTAGKIILVPAGFGFEGADMVVRDMDLMMLREQAIRVINAHRA